MSKSTPQRPTIQIAPVIGSCADRASSLSAEEHPMSYGPGAPTDAVR